VLNVEKNNPAYHAVISIEVPF